MAVALADGVMDGEALVAGVMVVGEATAVTMAEVEVEAKVEETMMTMTMIEAERSLWQVTPGLLLVLA